ncbi:uncharacterized protein LOC126846689 isoform X2 [Adelges cooleyi]|uniref:uncharacterized protein LOC126846689 isoform X2 n=1 Tax=Adelges cooleyi TaxID=133065 RepID=UPI00217FF168|nr:uncharacterized protein LOC126846689 isoform X2 [Adelges cooleyi]
MNVLILNIICVTCCISITSCSAKCRRNMQDGIGKEVCLNSQCECNHQKIFVYDGLGADLDESYLHESAKLVTRVDQLKLTSQRDVGSLPKINHFNQGTWDSILNIVKNKFMLIDDDLNDLKKELTQKPDLLDGLLWFVSLDPEHLTWEYIFNYLNKSTPSRSAAWRNIVNDLQEKERRRNNKTEIHTTLKIQQIS